MAEKIYITIPMDEELFFRFSEVVKNQNQSKYYVLESLMKYYIKKFSSPPPPPPPIQVYKTLTEKFLESFARKQRKVGELANIVLRRLLEKIVTDDVEIEELQKASGPKTVDNLGIEHGWYVNRNFGLSYPLLITEEHLQFDRGSNFYTMPLNINGEEYHLCSQWVEGIHRQKLEKWISKRLPEWLAETDEDSRNEMINWLKKL